MLIVPPGMVTLESTARHLHVSVRRLRVMVAETMLRQLVPISLGRSLGTYRLIPQLGIAVLRQMRSVPSYHRGAWQSALADFLSSATWQQATRQLSDVPTLRQDERGGRPALEVALLSESLAPTMKALHQESLSILDCYGLDAQCQIEQMIVDRLEDEDDAVVLVGEAQRAYLLPRSLLRAVGLDHEKAWGVLVATRTGAGIELDAWPAVGAGTRSAWHPDPELLAQRLDVGA